MKTDVANRFIWYKGQIINVNDAKVNVLSPTSQFGLNVFEGIPCYWNGEQKQLYLSDWRIIIEDCKSQPS